MTETAQINADFSRRVVVDSNEMDWQPSPSPTVWRKRLSLSGDAESGIVTSIVRYDADSAFPSHPHPGGEEIFVLDGVFSDEHGDYPAGAYLLNPDGFSHAPFSKGGCVLFVKLRQYAGTGRAHIMVDTGELPWEPAGPPGLWHRTLYTQPGFPETIRMVRAEPETAPWPHDHPGGEEVLVIEGELRDEDGVYPVGAWVRSPDGSRHAPFSTTGAVMLVRRGWMEGAGGG